MGGKPSGATAPMQSKHGNSPLHSSIRSDTVTSMNSFLGSELFDTWLVNLKDKVGKARVLHGYAQPNSGTSATTPRSEREYRRCGSTSAPAIASTSRAGASSS